MLGVYRNLVGSFMFVLFACLKWDCLYIIGMIYLVWVILNIISWNNRFSNTYEINFLPLVGYFVSMLFLV